MKLLLDTNIVLEVILEQTQAEAVRALVGRTERHELFLSDYSLHSIGLLLFRRQQHPVFRQFVEDFIHRAGTVVLSLPAEAMGRVVEAAERYTLNFDDAYQYVTAEHYDLTLLSFDHDFDRTPRRRQTPAELLSAP